ncbi:MAG: GNAT family N-acetyltransferase [Bacteroidaceae bacterium]|nr:GNAT family N-acetyltransferase [Bacteroidaceae bacterium]
MKETNSKEQSFLKNEHITLRAVELEDLEPMYEIENDSTTWDISSITVPYSRYTLRQFIEDTQSDLFADKQLRLMIVRNEDKCILGVIDITDFVPRYSHGAVGITIRKVFRQQGYATESLKLLCDYAFRFLSIKQLYAHIPTDNAASIQLFISCGFEKCGMMKEWFLSGNAYRDIYILQYINPLKK